MPVMKISNPITIRMIPPIIVALFENTIPNFFPSPSPTKQITNVSAPIISAATTAINKPYSAIVKPTDNASIDVAIPCTDREAVAIRAYLEAGFYYN